MAKSSGPQRHVAPPPAQGAGPLGPIQVVPAGLLGILQLKQLGRLPDKLSDLVVATIDLREWYFASRAQNEVQLLGGNPQVAVPTGGNTFLVFTIGAANAIVPPGFVWWVDHMSVQLIPTGAEVATDLIRYSGCLIQVGGVIQSVTNDASDYQLAARARSLDVHADRGFWALPGDRFAIRVWDSITTNGWTANLGLRATPMQL